MAHIAVPAMMIGSSLISASGQYASGKAKEKAAKAEAAQLEQNAKEAYGQKTREAFEAARQTKVALSDARAQQAGSGGVTTDPQAIQQLAEIQREGEYAVLDRMFQGKVKKQDLEFQAATRRHEGKLAKKASKIAAISTLLSGASSAFMSYSKLAPPGGTGESAANVFPHRDASKYKY